MFIRELISNASDAVEKLRYIQMSNEPLEDSHLPLEIHIASDDNKKTFTIQVFNFFIPWLYMSNVFDFFNIVDISLKLKRKTMWDNTFDNSNSWSCFFYKQYRRCLQLKIISTVVENGY